ncbi:hypothetical protein SS50377_27110 [Spironucleus salmonicida]|uniref:Uncharacterized protein n=1 Tax=Spironucleus salmonicida TaxID=348837 RepID=V6LGU5_9EUKA|nr:hypothetical protein SS50377_27110 [Spironucleus salmonicida]|eukprot:EST43765.1 Hypothetical protein SS50377_16504 [Spironucleus salmonicida]
MPSKKSYKTSKSRLTSPKISQEFAQIYPPDKYKLLKQHYAQIYNAIQEQKKLRTDIITLNSQTAHLAQNIQNLSELAQIQQDLARKQTALDLQQNLNFTPRSAADIAFENEKLQKVVNFYGQIAQISVAKTAKFEPFRAISESFNFAFRDFSNERNWSGKLKSNSNQAIIETTRNGQFTDELNKGLTCANEKLASAFSEILIRMQLIQ